MHLTYRNPNEAFRELILGIHRGRFPTVRTTSRAGDVLQIPEPVIITYTNPLERVLFNESRDSNHFFTCLESIWMLGGRNDVAPMKYYNSNISAIASDDGVYFHGAYGKRWRSWFGYDQLGEIIKELKKTPTSRRVVLSMWDACCCEEVKGVTKHDLYMAVNGGKDVPCNTAAYFLINQGRLDMTVLNRSNDLIWGSIGANVVHFSYLHEYIASNVGVPVGVYNQVSNNLHVYTERFKPEEWLADTTPDYYLTERAKPFPLIENPIQFEEELKTFNECCLGKSDADIDQVPYQEPFFAEVALRACLAFNAHKRRDYKEALAWCSEIGADDWRRAMTAWITKRQVNYQRARDDGPGHDNPYVVNEAARIRNGE